MKKSDQKFNIGDKVQWTSQSAGFKKVKTGVVVARFDAWIRPNAVFRQMEREGKISKYGGGYARNHESYAVEVPSKSGKGKPSVYWPLVSALKIVEP